MDTSKWKNLSEKQLSFFSTQLDSVIPNTFDQLSARKRDTFQVHMNNIFENIKIKWSQMKFPKSSTDFAKIDEDTHKIIELIRFCSDQKTALTDELEFQERIWEECTERGI